MEGAILCVLPLIFIISLYLLHKYCKIVFSFLNEPTFNRFILIPSKIFLELLTLSAYILGGLALVILLDFTVENFNILYNKQYIIYAFSIIKIPFNFVDSLLKTKIIHDLFIGAAIGWMFSKLQDKVGIIYELHKLLIYFAIFFIFYFFEIINLNGLIICGALCFIYHNAEVSFRSIINNQKKIMLKILETQYKIKSLKEKIENNYNEDEDDDDESVERRARQNAYYYDLF